MVTVINITINKYFMTLLCKSLEKYWYRKRKTAFYFLFNKQTLAFGKISYLFYFFFDKKNVSAFAETIFYL